ncbi:hypothetical protein ILUMI_18997, partial [Ignelater luminosus]
GSSKLTKAARKLECPPVQSARGGTRSRSDIAQKCGRKHLGYTFDDAHYPDDSEEDLNLPCCRNWNPCIRLRGYCRPCSGCSFPPPHLPTTPDDISTTYVPHTVPNTPSTPRESSTLTPDCITPCEPSIPDIDIDGEIEKELPWDPSIPVVINPNYNDKPGKFTCSIVFADTEKPLCSATIISLHFAVTACLRCLFKNKRPLAPRHVKIIVPQFTSDTHGIGLDMYKIERIIVHPACIFKNRYNAAHDIGILKTVDEIEYGSTITPIKIPTVGYRPNSKINWMITSFRPKHTIATTYKEAVWYVKVKIIKQDTCSLIFNKTFYDPNKNFCTPYHHVGGDENCQVIITT